MILGFDISTTTVAWSILDEKGDVILTDYIELSKVPGDLHDRLKYFIKAFKERIKPHAPTIKHVAAEAALLKFTWGKSNAGTLAKLQAFNFGLTYLVGELLRKKVKFYQFSTARKTAGLTFPKTSTPKEKKEIIRQYCEKKYPTLVWPRKKTGTYKDYCYDVSDSLMISEQCLHSLRKPSKVTPELNESELATEVEPIEENLP